MDNSTLPTADRTTHAKIIALSLAASVAAGLVGMTAHGSSADTGPAMKAGKPVAVSHSGVTAIR